MEIIKNSTVKPAPNGRPKKHSYPLIDKIKVGEGLVIDTYSPDLRQGVNSAITCLYRAGSKKKFSVIKDVKGMLIVKRIK